jgi:hypothetical protein
MPNQKHHPILRSLSYTAMLLSLIACERETYTSWNCQSSSETKIPMVLRRAQMEFQGLELKYCGSLGDQSYFDQTCTKQTEQSNTVFSQNWRTTATRAKLTNVSPYKPYYRFS